MNTVRRARTLKVAASKEQLRRIFSKVSEAALNSYGIPCATEAQAVVLPDILSSALAPLYKEIALFLRSIPKDATTVDFTKIETSNLSNISCGFRFTTGVCELSFTLLCEDGSKLPITMLISPTGHHTYLTEMISAGAELFTVELDMC